MSDQQWQPGEREAFVYLALRKTLDELPDDTPTLSVMDALCMMLGELAASYPIGMVRERMLEAIVGRVGDAFDQAKRKGRPIVLAPGSEKPS